MNDHLIYAHSRQNSRKFIRSTPQRLLANVLKNNFLKDSAISGEKRRAYQRNKEPFNNNKRRSKNNAPQKMSALNNFTPL